MRSLLPRRRSSWWGCPEGRIRFKMTTAGAGFLDRGQRVTRDLEVWALFAGPGGLLRAVFAQGVFPAARQMSTVRRQHLSRKGLQARMWLRGMLRRGWTCDGLKTK